MLNKIFFNVLAIAIILFAVVWTFNHVNPWLAWVIFIGLTYYASTKIFKNNKKQNK
jgi:hypothetical protein